MGGKIKNIAGQRFGRLTILARGPDAEGKARITWLCRCDCGIEKTIKSRELHHGDALSCGCLARDMTARRSTKHGAAKRGQETTEFVIWTNMINRCHKPSSDSYLNYGARGISVCHRWRNDFAAFLADVGPRPSSKHSIDRYPDKDGNYEPGNVRWATWKEQARNKRDNILLLVNGVQMTLAEAVERSGLEYSTVHARIHRHKWPLARALGLGPEQTAEFIPADQVRAS